MKKHFFITIFVVLLVNVLLFMAEAQPWGLTEKWKTDGNIYHGDIGFAEERLFYVTSDWDGPKRLESVETEFGVSLATSRVLPSDVSSRTRLAIPLGNPFFVAITAPGKVYMYPTGKKSNWPRDSHWRGLMTLNTPDGREISEIAVDNARGKFLFVAKSSGPGEKGIIEAWYVGFAHTFSVRRYNSTTFSNYSADALAMGGVGYQYFFKDRDHRVDKYGINSMQKQFTYTRRGKSDVVALACQTRGYIASGYRDGDVLIWNDELESFVRRLKGPPSAVGTLVFTQDRRFLAASYHNDDVVYVWNVSSGDLVMRIDVSHPLSVAFSPKGTLAILSIGTQRSDSGIYIYKQTENTTLGISKRKLDSATLIDGLKIQKNRMYDVELPDLSFGYSGDNEFLLLSQGRFNTCGTASVEMILHYYGKKATQSQIWKAGGIHNVENLGGTWPMEAEQALGELGVPSTWYNRGTLDQLKHHVRHNRPPMIILRFQAGMHYVVVVGYNSGNDFLVADPNGFFRWISGSDLLKGWSLKEPGLPDSYRAVNIANWFQNRAAGLIGENNYIVPDSPPQYHFRPNWSELQYAHVIGPSKANWGWFATTEWERTLEFRADFDHYVWSRVEPSSVSNPGGIRVSAVDGHRRNGRRVKFWGKVTHGKAQRGELYLFVRSYRHPRSTVAAAPSLDLIVDSIESLPARSEVFSNYPNPFNPETWIPYQLAESAEVTVDIYAADGQLVRTLSIGHQTAGVYRSRSRAAYWDGRNDVGEYVASGIYFYTLKAGEFAATRKMLIVK